MQPLLYFSYGMTKTGSTLAFELVRSALDLCGYPQDRLDLDVIAADANVNFVNHISETQLQTLWDEVEKRGYPIVLKTHTRPKPHIVKMIRAGKAIAHAGYRDPRDMLLSLLDHGKRAREAGKKSFSNLHTTAEALENIRQQHNTLTAWLRLPATMPLYFEDIAFDMEATTQKLIDRLGLKIDPSIVVDVVLSQRFTQKNKGLRLRYPDEMSPDLSAEIKAEFAPLFERFITNRHDLKNTRRILLPKPYELRTSAPD